MGVYKILREDIGELSINAMYDRCLVALYSINHSDTDAAMYDSTIHDEQIEKKNIESKMHEALQNGEFRVYVQPKYRTGNAKLAAGEALIRWIDPEKGMIPPIKFIPVFEQNRFVHDIDLYVMEVVSRFIRMRLNDGLPVVPISLNISPVEITMPNFKDAYIDIKEKYNIPDGLIELEFTEGIFFENEFHKSRSDRINCQLSIINCQFLSNLKNITHAQKDCNGFGENLRKNITFYELTCA